MRIFKKELHVDFLKYRKVGLVFSMLLIVASVASLAMNRLNFGLDFTGGTLIEVGFSEDADITAVREDLETMGIQGAVVQFFGNSQDITIRMPPQKDMVNDEVGGLVLEALRADGTDVEMRRIDFVGPSVGDELAEEGALAMLVALICIMIYVALRFEWKFALGSVAALAHDVTIVLGFFSITQLEFDLTVLAALLAVIGYSLNDTIVVFDRIRENFIKVRKGGPEDVVNLSLNQTFSRTIITSLTTLLVLIALFVFGGALIHDFAIALIAGVLIGTYSSIYVASAIALALGATKEDLMPPQVEKEGAEFDNLP